MSGGVDSSVAAALCLEAGHRVVGVMLRLWADEGAAAGANRCCAPDAVVDARAVADRLGIPFHVLDTRAAFKRVVVDRFVADAVAGDTPNPCFTCNHRIRFGRLLGQVRALGADALATGHYARVRRAPGGAVELLRGTDRHKDQSYMLHRLGQKQLRRALFPIGNLKKPDVRALAERLGLPVARRPDSVDLCWVGQGGLGGFLSRHLPAGAARPGPIVDTNGRALGQHRGLAHYTVGQRRGLGVATGAPIYVIARDQAANTLVVGPADALGARRVAVRDVSWISGRPLEGPTRVTAQVRYRAPAAPATLTPGPDATADVLFDAPQRAPTPGQGLVFYNDDVVLGGGLIAPPQGTSQAVPDIRGEGVGWPSGGALV